MQTESFSENIRVWQIDAFDGTKLHVQKASPTDPPRATVIIVHGLAEHSGRYEHVISYLNAAGYVVWTFDLRGHGRSEGERTFVKSFDDYLRDLDLILTMARAELSSRPVFLLGHSMGGAIATLFTITYRPALAGLLLSAASLQISPSVSPFLVKIAPLISALLPKLKTIVLDGSAISRDQSVVDSYNNDLLNYRGGIPARTGAELNAAIRRIQSQMKNLDCPLLIMHGTVDRLADISGSHLLYNQARSRDKTLKLYQDFYHEILNDPEKMRVMNDIRAWLDTRTGF
jgi:alpha-beta hydrolase superfamily lysophospholipase